MAATITDRRPRAFEFFSYTFLRVAAVVMRLCVEDRVGEIGYLGALRYRLTVVVMCGDSWAVRGGTEIHTVIDG